jgi:hypothetical protein
MFLKNICFFVVIASMILFPSCIKYYELSKSECYQGKSLSDRKEISKNNLRALNIHDQFSTLAIFDFLWLSDEARSAYVDMNSIRKGKDKQAKHALLTRQLEENKHWITFYVLADIKDNTDGSLSDKNSPWSLYLVSKDDRKVCPNSIKEIEIEPEYKFLFGPKFDLFGRIYEVKFPAADLAGVPYIQHSEAFKVVLCSPRKEGEIWWNKLDSCDEKLIKKGKKRKILKNEDFYWGRPQGV